MVPSPDRRWSRRKIVAWLAVATLVSVADGQICNSDDPDSGGLLISAFGSGNKITCRDNTDETIRLKDPYYYNSTKLYPNGTGVCEVLTTEDSCRAAGMTGSTIKSQCKWTNNMCTARVALWGCECAEFSEEPDPDMKKRCESNPDGDVQIGMAPVYVFLLLWSFMGVGIIADVFMEAIGVITSQSTLVEKADPKTGEKHQLEIMAWNATVANLTLMALGSSAPEILLSVIEIVTSEPSPCFSGALGPSTIVGSAAFNMLVICGICVICIPEKNDETGEPGVRKIADMNVFGITAFSSIFAYVWLLVILLATSPNVVALWEAMLTFLFFPALVVVAWMADKGYFSSKSTVAPAQSIVGTKDSQGDLTTFRPSEVKSLLKSDGHRAMIKTDPEVLAREAYFKSKPKTRADRRIEATRAMTGSKPLHESALEDEDGVSLRSWMGFQCTDFRVAEGDGLATIIVERSGNSTYGVSCEYETVQGTATAGSDFVPITGTVSFSAGETVQEIQIKINADEIKESEESFSVQLKPESIKTHSHSIPDRSCEVSHPNSGYTNDWTRAVITIEDSTEPSVVNMSETSDVSAQGHTASYKCFESDGRVLVKVERTGSCARECSVKYATKEGTATGDRDYEEVEGTLVFKPGQSSQSIEIKIIDDDQFEDDEDFTISIFDGEGCEVGGLQTAVTTIVNDDEMTDVIERVANLFALNLDKYKAGGASWKEQFIDAISIPDGCSNKVSHFLNLPWKLAFAVCPPPGFLGGWICFFISLGLIGVVTALIGDLAGLFGCSVGMKDEVTAITFVALGTSLPDTFASKAAAIGDKTADASIGNVTGSNSVNVFLGLGMPWLLAAAYWGAVKPGEAAFDDWIDYVYVRSGLNLDEITSVLADCGGTGPCFVVPAGALGFSVIVFSLCGVTCLSSLTLRRYLYGAELGGRAKYPFGIFFIFLWFVYVALSSSKSYALI